MAITARLSNVRIEVTQTGAEIVDELSCSIAEGEIVGLVGESGSCKTTVALALLGHVKHGTRFAGGSVKFEGQELVGCDTRTLRELRGKVVSYVPQDPAAALDPALRISRQLGEVLDSHDVELDSSQRLARIRESLERVRLPSDDAFLRRYPHQLSGGQQQRVCIAMAFMLRPRMIVLDEPTTGLDVTTQAHILELVRELCLDTRTSALYVSHDLAAVGSLAERVLVMYAGRLVESGPTREVLDRPGHPYTRKLIAAIPDVGSRRILQSIPGVVPAPGQRGTGCVFTPRCPFAIDACAVTAPPDHMFSETHSVRCLRAEDLGRPVIEVAHHTSTAGEDGDVRLRVSNVSASYGDRTVLNDVSLVVLTSECLALVGESGSGKTTLSRCLVGLHTAWSGEISLGSERLAQRIRDRTVEQCRKVQYVFQSPYNSLNPRRTVGDSVRTAVERFFSLRGAEAERRAAETLERVSISPRLIPRYPDELSGGERQRVAIARALAAQPEMLICDEVTSALDASVQAGIVRLL